MSHAGSWRAACSLTISISLFHFESPEVARGVTDPGVGSGALLGLFSSVDYRRESAASNQAMPETQQTYFQSFTVRAQNGFKNQNLAMFARSLIAANDVGRAGLMNSSASQIQP